MITIILIFFSKYVLSDNPHDVPQFIIKGALIASCAELTRSLQSRSCKTKLR